ncbi:hypothetical protein FQR65_LT10342 [Abscondita terminalis]|nr:hypothetical protein FQR65_LT10342 [Abscondita terminalis]
MASAGNEYFLRLPPAANLIIFSKESLCKESCLYHSIYLKVWTIHNLVNIKFENFPTMLDICDNELLINELKCNQCSKILSEPPVYCSSGNGNLCGRCFEVSDTLIKDGSMQQAVAYEAVAQFLLFPCCNHEHGCKTKLKWKEAAQHEQECEFASTPCPFNLEFENTSIKCDWIGIRRDVNLHLNNNHNNDLQRDLLSSLLEVDVTYVKMFFTVIDNLIFLVITKFVKILNKFYCAVVSYEDQLKIKENALI